MGARLFSSGTPTQIQCASSGTLTIAGQTIAALVTVTSLPGAAVYGTIGGIASVTAARRFMLHLNGDTGPGTLSILNGSTRIVPSTSIIPTADGRWMLVGCSKATGTTVTSFFMYDFVAQSWTEFDSSGTAADQTLGSVFGCLGSENATASSYFDGRIAMFMYLPVNLTQVQWRSLINGPWYWRALAAQIIRRPMSSSSVSTAPFGLFYDFRDEQETGTVNALIGNTNIGDMQRSPIGAKAMPVFDASSTPSGF